MIQVGSLCVKIAGRDAGKTCAVVNVIDKNFVTIDGATRRRRCNISHLMPLNQSLDIKQDASHDEVEQAFKAAGLDVHNTKAKESKPRPKKKRKTSEELRAQKEKRKKEKQTTTQKPEAKKADTLEEKAGLKESDDKKPAKKETAQPSENKK